MEYDDDDRFQGSPLRMLATLVSKSMGSASSLLFGSDTKDQKAATEEGVNRSNSRETERPWSPNRDPRNNLLHTPDAKKRIPIAINSPNRVPKSGQTVRMRQKIPPSPSRTEPRRTQTPNGHDEKLSSIAINDLKYMMSPKIQKQVNARPDVKLSRQIQGVNPRLYGVSPYAKFGDVTPERYNMQKPSMIKRKSSLHKKPSMTPQSGTSSANSLLDEHPRHVSFNLDDILDDNDEDGQSDVDQTFASGKNELNSSFLRTEKSFVSLQESSKDSSIPRKGSQQKSTRLPEGIEGDVRQSKYEDVMKPFEDEDVLIAARWMEMMSLEARKTEVDEERIRKDAEDEIKNKASYADEAFKVLDIAIQEQRRLAIETTEILETNLIGRKERLETELKKIYKKKKYEEQLEQKRLLEKKRAELEEKKRKQEEARKLKAEAEAKEAAKKQQEANEQKSQHEEDNRSSVAPDLEQQKEEALQRIAKIKSIGAKIQAEAKTGKYGGCIPMCKKGHSCLHLSCVKGVVVKLLNRVSDDVSSISRLSAKLIWLLEWCKKRNNRVHKWALYCLAELLVENAMEPPSVKIPWTVHVPLAALATIVSTIPDHNLSKALESHLYYKCEYVLPDLSQDPCEPGNPNGLELHVTHKIKKGVQFYMCLLQAKITDKTKRALLSVREGDVKLSQYFNNPESFKPKAFFGGSGKAWRWMSMVLNRNPLHIVTPCLLRVFLKTMGLRMKKMYGRQMIKVLELIKSPSGIERLNIAYKRAKVKIGKDVLPVIDDAIEAVTGNQQLCDKLLQASREHVDLNRLRQFT
eukprot:CAMPEP_0167760210 /NCGR_PEP_ID=MMETSP0110_2-20121227/11461_1 /TAXON_ID=629695 /ORGANISM="Gymnochlora sp., Strain CCMP2014" /LENGTH=803 /DNA_ID=CAMNT_0007646699 /DNA_START=21 /DNA_END=2428 /DNA_ORIENTATION=+